MNYKLAKQLQDAGFPDSENWYEDGIGFVKSEGEYLHEVEFEVPTLSELIEACGDKFRDLSLMSQDWITYGFRIELDELYTARGKTAEEAVAKLWLELNKKT